MYIENGTDLERVKMDNIQVMEVLKQKMTADQMKILNDQVQLMLAAGFSGRKALAHAIMEAYKLIGTDETVRSGFRQLQKKYFNGARDLGGEQEACIQFMEYVAQ